MTSQNTLTDSLEIRALIDNWALWRDAGDWDRFRTVWHDDGRMMATWFQIDPVDPAATLRLDAELLARFPIGYRHLACLQARIGYEVEPAMPGLDGPAVERLYACGRDWLSGGELSPVI